MSHFILKIRQPLSLHIIPGQYFLHKHICISKTHSVLELLPLINIAYIQCIIKNEMFHQ